MANAVFRTVTLHLYIVLLFIIFVSNRTTTLWEPHLNLYPGSTSLLRLVLFQSLSSTSSVIALFLVGLRILITKNGDLSFSFLTQMNHKYLLPLCLVLLVAAACNKAEITQQNIRLYAVIGQEGDTRVELQEDLRSIFWSPEDHITVYTKNGECATFISENKEPAATTMFSGTLVNYSPGDSLWARYPEANYGIYNGKMEVGFGGLQKAVKNGIDPASYLCVAKSNTDVFTFHNVCGGFAFSVVNDDIVSVKFKANNGESLCGGFFVSMDDHGIPSTESASWGSKDYVLLYSPGGKTLIPGAMYYFTLPPCELTEGFTLILQNTSGEVAEIPFNKPVSIRRSVYGRSFDVDKDATFEDSGIPEDYLIVQQILAEDGQYYDDLRVSPQVVFDDNNHAKSLVLYSNSESGALSEAIGKLSELESLTLSGYRSIPEALANCKKLKILDISYCDVGSLPGSLSDLELESLRIIHCGLELFPEFIYDIHSLKELDLTDTNFNKRSSLSSRICELTSLEKLILHNCWLSGEFPESIGDLSSLRCLDCACYNWFTNGIPASINRLTNLEYLDLSYAFQPVNGQHFPDISALTNLRHLDLGDCSIVGEIPESIGLLTNLEYLNWSVNYISGDIPESVTSLTAWHRYGYKSIWQGPLGLDIYNTPSTLGLQFPYFSTIDLMSGEHIDNDALLGANELTLLVVGLPSVHDDLKILYDKYKDRGLGFLFTDLDEDLDVNRIQEAGFERFVCINKGTLGIEVSVAPSYYLFDKNGHFMGASPDSFTSVHESIQGVLGDVELDIYASSDYSMDHTTKNLSSHKIGQGVHIVLMGDGFSDRLIADGTYDHMMQLASDSFFSAEPYHSFKDLFDVDIVYAVSMNEQYVDGSETAFSCKVAQNSTLITGDSSKVIQYVETAYPDLDLAETLIIVIVNYARYAGTCYMSHSSDIDGDYGNGLAVAFCTVDDKGPSFAGIVLHEAGGHGFAKLADEYPGPGTISQEEISSCAASIASGWYKNIDFTDDPSTVKWHRFLEDDRYDKENLGCYEGGLVYQYGVWRPSSNSIMAYGYDSGFNAPSREAIYYRLHKLAFGNDWQYNYETFVEYDVQANSAAQTTSMKKRSPLGKPIILEGLPT